MIRLDIPLSLGPYRTKNWSTAVFLFVSYIGAFAAITYVAPAATGLAPAVASAIALAAIFFGGVRLAPIALAAAVLANTFAGLSLGSSLLPSLFETLEAMLGAYFLRALHVDPLFRRYSDTFSFFSTIALVSLGTPALALLSSVGASTLPSAAELGRAYVTSITGFLIVTPFLLRWLAKPRFGRRWLEVGELICIFTVLLVLEYVMFVQGADTYFGIPLNLALLAPFFWIALRLRPRFLTLALLITAVFMLGHAIASVPPQSVIENLFSAELALIALAVSFFIIVSLEEDRRVNRNIMRNQLATLENAVARVVSESRAKNDFIAILAHELRNPLAPIVIGIDLMKIKGGYDKEDTNTLAMMSERMTAVRRLLDDLLDISRIREGKVDLVMTQVDLGETLHRAIISTEYYRAERHQALVYRVSPERHIVLGDDMRLEQVFSNLLTNASKYSDPGTTVTLSTQVEDASVEVEIADEGVGIEPSALDDIFTPFYQLPEGERSKKGLGIGLSLVRSFINLHGGSVKAVSNGRGLGSRFIVRLPLQTDAVQVEPGQPAPPPLAKHGPLVLVVDDNDALAASIGRLLEIQGCSVAYAYDGRQAVERIFNLNPDLVLLDIDLPYQDGYAVARTVRRQGWQGRIVAHTGYTLNVREKAADAGMQDYLAKPAGIDDLRRILADADQAHL